MTPEIPDADLTAYALNELPPEQTAAVTARLATDPEARRAVDHIRATAAALTTHFAAEVGDPAVAAPARLGYAPAGRRRWRSTAIALAAAAAVAVGVAGVYLALTPRSRSGSVVYRPPPSPPAVAFAATTRPQSAWGVSGGGGGMLPRTSYGGRPPRQMLRPRNRRHPPPLQFMIRTGKIRCRPWRSPR